MKREGIYNVRKKAEEIPVGKERLPEQKFRFNKEVKPDCPKCKKNKKILAYIAYKQKVDSGDHSLQQKTGLDRLSLNRRLKELTEAGILDYFLDQYGKRIYITRKLT